MKTRIRILSLLTITALAPLTMAPDQDACPTCLLSEEGSLAHLQTLGYGQDILDGKSYYAEFRVDGGDATLTVTGDITQLNCTKSGGDTVCTFGATRLFEPFARALRRRL